MPIATKSILHANICLNKIRIKVISQRDNRKISSRSNRKGYIRAFLRRRQAAREIVVILSSDIRLTAFRNVGHKRTGIDTLNGSIINRNNERILKILIAEPLIHNESIGAERESRYTNTCNLNRQAKIIGQSTNIPTANRRRNLRYRILRLGYPRAFSVFTVKLLPMLPHKSVRHEKVVGIKVNIVHQRGQKGLHTDYLGTANIECIAGKNFLAEKRDDITGIKRSLDRSRAVKGRTAHVNTGRIKRKMRFNVTIQLYSPPV